MALFSTYILIYILLISILSLVLSFISTGITTSLKYSEEKCTKIWMVVQIPIEIFIIYSIIFIADWFNSKFEVPLMTKPLLYFTGICVFYLISYTRKANLIESYAKEYNDEMVKFSSKWSVVTGILFALAFILFISIKIEFLKEPILFLIQYIDKLLQYLLLIKFVNNIVFIISWLLCIGCILGATWRFIIQIGLLIKMMLPKS